MPGLMSGDWKRSTVSGPQRLQFDAWTAPDLSATAPALDSTQMGNHRPADFTSLIRLCRARVLCFNRRHAEGDKIAMKRTLVGTTLVLALMTSASGTAMAQMVPPANADQRAPCTAQLASSFGPATGGIADEVAGVQAIAEQLGLPLGQVVKVAAATQGTVAECVELLQSL